MKIGYLVRADASTFRDAAIVLPEEILADAVAESVVNSISTAVHVELGGTTVHLAMLLDPDHWQGSWAEAGIEDVDGFLVGLAEAS